MRTLIWTLPTRFFHWLLAFGFAITYILGDFDQYRNFHFAFGAFVGMLILFRLFFGLIGPKYSNFRDFHIGFNSQREFILNFTRKVYSGHTPAASVVMLGILIVGVFCSISGYLRYATENNIITPFLSEDSVEEIHEVLANLFLALVIVHLSGLLADTLLHWKTRTLTSMITGYKHIEAENAKLNGFQKLFSVLWFIVPLFVAYLAFGLPVNESQKDGGPNTEESQHLENEEGEDD